MKKYRLTIFGLIISTVLYLSTVLTGYDLFERVIAWMHRLEEFEVDELMIPLMILMLFALIDQFKRRKSEAVKHENLKVYKAMLASSYHVINNFLNQMFLFRITAENTKGFPVEVLEQYDEIMEDTRSKLESLGNVKNIDESSILRSVKIEPSEELVSTQD